MKPNETDKFNPSYWRGETGFFDKLLRLPLFQGIGRNDFLEIAERVRLGFRKVTRETTLVQQDEPCNSLIFVMRGGIRTSRESDAHTYTLAEWINQPLVISPESLFGLHPRYTHKVVVSESAEILQIDKAAVRDILFDYPTFRINFLNILSGRLQRSSHLLWRPLPTIPEQCFTHFLLVRCLRPAGRKQLHIKMQQLALELQDTRLNVSAMLHRLAERQLIIMGRGRIDVPALELLIQEASNF